MKTFFLAAILALTLGAAGHAQISPSQIMKITSPDIASGGDIPEQFTCDGRNQSPNLRFVRVPEKAKSLVLIMDDPDAPKGTFTHWIVWNIPPDRTEIIVDTVPGGAVQGINDAGKPGYMGPCPPTGSHRYYFRLYALDTTLNLPPKARRADLEKAIKGHVLNDAILMGRYVRKAVEDRN